MLKWTVRNSNGLEDEGRPETENGVPIRNSSNEQEARYCHLVGENKAGSATGTDCTMGREKRRMREGT